MCARPTSHQNYDRVSVEFPDATLQFRPVYSPWIISSDMSSAPALSSSGGPWIPVGTPEPIRFDFVGPGDDLSSSVMFQSQPRPGP